MKQTTQETIDNYVKYGFEPGGFVTAVLANDLMGALARADEQNRADIYEIAIYIYNNIPSGCHGSYKKVDLWLEKKRGES